MRHVFTRGLTVRAMVLAVVLAVVGGTLAIPAAPALASTPQALGALRDRLAELAPVGSSAVVDPVTGEVVVRVAGAAAPAFQTAVARNRPGRTVNAPPVHTNALLMGGQAMDSHVCTRCSVTPCRTRNHPAVERR